MVYRPQLAVIRILFPDREALTQLLYLFPVSQTVRALAGDTLDCSGVQIGALIDELFTYSGPLGCQVLAGGLGDIVQGVPGVSLALWAPTAVRSTLCY